MAIHLHIFLKMLKEAIWSFIIIFMIVRDSRINIPSKTMYFQMIGLKMYSLLQLQNCWGMRYISLINFRTLFMRTRGFLMFSRGIDRAWITDKQIIKYTWNLLSNLHCYNLTKRTQIPKTKLFDTLFLSWQFNKKVIWKFSLWINTCSQKKVDIRLCLYWWLWADIYLQG